MKHYLVITPFFPSKDSFRGVYVYDQVKEIKRQTGCKVSVIVLNNSLKERYTYQGIECIPFNVVDFPSFVFPGLFNKLNSYRMLSALKDNDIVNVDFVHAHVNYPAAHLAIELKLKFPKAKFIIQHHGLDVYQQKNGRFKSVLKLFQSRSFKKLSNRVLSSFDANIGVSKKVLQNLDKEVLNNSKPIVLYNGVDTEKFFNLHQKSTELFSIGCVANFWSIKDQQTLIKAALLSLEEGLRLKVIFIGSGPTLNSCKRLVPNKYISCFEFLEEVVHDELNAFYNKINLFVLPSYYEAFGCVYIESWATNTPFVAVKSQGIEEVMSEEMKELYLVQAGDVVDLYNKIKRFFRQKETIPFDSVLDIKNTIKEFIKKVENI